jgi:hypothetical protein
MRWSIDRGRGGVHSDVARRAGRGRRTARPRRAVAVRVRCDLAASSLAGWHRVTVSERASRHATTAEVAWRAARCGRAPPPRDHCLQGRRVPGTWSVRRLCRAGE